MIFSYTTKNAEFTQRILDVIRLFNSYIVKYNSNKTINSSFNINLSSEVYFLSFQVAKNSITHKPFGYGINNYNKAFDEFIVTQFGEAGLPALKL